RNELPARGDSHRAMAICSRNACGLAPADFPVRIYRCCRSNGAGRPFSITIAHGARCGWPAFHRMGRFCGDEAHEAILAGQSIFHGDGKTRLTGPMLSPPLHRSIQRALEIASEQRSGRATPEHLLLALADDPDAAPVMRACNVDIERLRGA